MKSMLLDILSMSCSSYGKPGFTKSGGVNSQATELGTSGLALGTAESMLYDIRLHSKVLYPMGVLWSVSHCSLPNTLTLLVL